MKFVPKSFRRIEFKTLPILTIAALITSSGSTSAQSPAVSGTGLPGLATRVAFPGLQFDRPVAMACPDDGSNLIFIAEQHAAKIWSFPNIRETTDKQLFLSLIHI